MSHNRVFAISTEHSVPTNEQSLKQNNVITLFFFCRLAPLNICKALMSYIRSAFTEECHADEINEVPSVSANIAANVDILNYRRNFVRLHKICTTLLTPGKDF